MADETRSVRVLLRAEANQLVLEFGKAGAASNQLAGNFDRSGKSLNGMIRQARNLALAGGIAKAVKSAVELEAAYSRTMAMIAVQTKAPQDELKKLDALAMQLGRDTVFSAQDAADAMLSLAKGGLSVGQIKAGALKDSLTLAAAGGLELDEAAKAVVNSMGAFELRADQTGVAVAALAGAANASSADVSDITQALAQAGTEAHSVGLSVQETTAFLAAFANAGIKGSDAGTSLRTMLQRLVPQTQKQRDEMNRLHLSFTDANGEFVNAEQIAQRMQDTFGDMSAKERSLALSTIFGSDARRAANIITRLGADGTRKLINETSDLTQAQKLADANMSGTAGAIEQLKGSVETLGIEFGKALAPAVQDTANALTELINIITPAVDAFSDLPEPVQELLILAAATTAVTAGVRTMGRAGRGGATDLIVLGGGARQAAAETGLLVTALRRIPLALAAIEGFKVFGDVADGLSRRFKDLKVSGDDFVDTFDGAGKATQETSDALLKAFDNGQLGDNAKDLGIDLQALADDMAKNGTQGEYFGKTFDKLTRKADAWGLTLGALDKASFDLIPGFDASEAVSAHQALEEISKAFREAEKTAKGFAAFASGMTFDLNFGTNTFKDAAGNVRVLADELKTLPPKVQSTFTLQGLDLSEKQLVDFIAKYNLTDVQIQALLEADATPADATLEDLKSQAKVIKTQLVMDDLQAPISTLLNGLGGLGPIVVPVDADPAPAKETVARTRTDLASNVATILIDGNTEAADQAREDLLALINGSKPVVPVDANTAPGKSDVNSFVNDTNSKSATVTVRVKILRQEVLSNFDNLQSGLGGDGGFTGGRIGPHGSVHFAGGGKVPGVPPRNLWEDNVRARTPAGHRLMVRSREWIINQQQSDKNDNWLRAINNGLDLNRAFGPPSTALRYPVRHAAGGLDPSSSGGRVFATPSASGAAAQAEFGVISADLKGARVDIGKDGVAKFVDGRVELGIRRETKYRAKR